MDIGFIKILLFCLKLVAYTSNPQSAEIDLLIDGNYQGSFSYALKDKRMIVYSVKGERKTTMMTVSTIDNGLYSVKMGEGSPMEIDLAGWFMKLDWKKLGEANKNLKLNGDVTLSLTVSRSNLYVQYDSLTFIIDKKLLKKK
jgi:hypothetical protein